MDEERPIECNQCKKTLTVQYKEIAHGTITTTKMCSDCPVLQKKLHGCSSDELSQPDFDKHLECHNCHTSYEEITAGTALGCEQCYAVFEGAVLHFLKSHELIAPHMGPALHLGPTSDGKSEVGSFQQVMELNDELNKALAQENYEEAAWLRDQIKTMKELPNDSSDG